MLMLSEAIDTFLAEPFSAGTKRYRRRFLLKFIEHLGDVPVASITVAMLTTFRHTLTDAAPSVPSQCMKSIQAFFAWLHRATDEVCLDPRRIIVPRINSEPFRAFTDQELEALRRAILSQEPGRMRDRDLAAFEVMYCTGFRRNELQRIRPVDIDWRNGSITVTGKFSKRVRGLISPDAEQAVRAILDETRPQTPLFPQSPNWLHIRFRVWGELAGLKKCHPHMLRKSCGTDFYRRTKDIELTRKLLNHENVATTQRYLCLGDDDLRSAHAFVFGEGEHSSLTVKREGLVILQASLFTAKGIDIEALKAALSQAVDNLL